MDAALIFEAYAPVFAAQVVELWNATAMGDSFPLTERLWRQQTEGDPDFENADCHLVFSPERKLVGFVLTKIWRGKIADAQLKTFMVSSENRGALAAIVVRPPYQRQGLGRYLVNWAEQHLKEQQATTISLGGGMRHFFPGVPTTLPALKPYFSQLGYQFAPTANDVHDLHGSLINLDLSNFPAKSHPDYFFTQGQQGDEKAILEFMARSFPNRWNYEMQLFLQQGGDLEDVTLLKSRNNSVEGFQMNYHSDSKIIGPSIYWSKLLAPHYGGIGPLGISEQVRGLGLGLGLVANGARYLQKRGVTDCVIDWTDLVAFYGKLGFSIWKSYRYASKTLT